LQIIKEENFTGGQTILAKKAKTTATLVLVTTTIARRTHLTKQVKNQMEKLIKRSAIALDYAVLCLDCNCVSDANRECPACSSRALMNLSNVLDRRELDPREFGRRDNFSDSRELAVA
jgi:hypothetical protein